MPKLEDYSSADLLAWKAANPDKFEDNPQLAAEFEAALVDARVRETLARERKKQEAEARGKELDKRAEKMWPELKDKDSAISKKVAEKLNNDPSLLNDPEVVFHTATQAGLELGLLPAGFQPAKRTNPQEGIGAGESGGDEGGPKGKTFVQETAHVAEALSDLIGGDEKLIERINARGEAQREESNG